MSAVFNIAGAALVLPNAALALFFLAVGVVVEQKTLGALLKSVWVLLGKLPQPEYLALIVLAVLAAIALAIVALIRFPLLVPLLIVVIGVASLVCVTSFVGAREFIANPLGWSCLAGVALGGWQLWRGLTAAAPLPS